MVGCGKSSVSMTVSACPLRPVCIPEADRRKTTQRLCENVCLDGVDRMLFSDGIPPAQCMPVAGLGGRSRNRPRDARDPTAQKISPRHRETASFSHGLDPERSLWVLSDHEHRSAISRL